MPLYPKTLHRVRVKKETQEGAFAGQRRAYEKLRVKLKEDGAEMTGFVIIGLLGIVGCLSGLFMLIVAMKSLKKAEKILAEAKRLHDDGEKIIEKAQGYSAELAKQENRIKARIAEFTA